MGAMIGITVLQWHAEHNPGDPANYTIIIFPYLFYVFFNISWGVGSWTYAAEIFPVSMRAKGNALTTASLWTACYIVAQASPPIADAIGWGLYIIYSGICVIAFFFVRYAMGSFILQLSGILANAVQLKHAAGPSRKCLDSLELKATWPSELVSRRLQRKILPRSILRIWGHRAGSMQAHSRVSA
jgi:hypothetical protein